MDNTVEEIEHPKRYVEYISGEQSWEEVGIYIGWTDPIQREGVKTITKTPMKLRACIRTKRHLHILPKDLAVFCWTTIVTKENPYGVMRDTQLRCNPKCSQCDDNDVQTYVFKVCIQALKVKDHKVAFSVKHGDTTVWSCRLDTLVGHHSSIGTQTLQKDMLAMENFEDIYTTKGSEGQCYHSKDMCIRIARHETSPQRQKMEEIQNQSYDNVEQKKDKVDTNNKHEEMKESKEVDKYLNDDGDTGLSEITSNEGEKKDNYQNGGEENNETRESHVIPENNYENKEGNLRSVSSLGGSEKMEDKKKRCGPFGWFRRLTGNKKK